MKHSDIIQATDGQINAMLKERNEEQQEAMALNVLNEWEAAGYDKAVISRMKKQFFPFLAEN